MTSSYPGNTSKACDALLSALRTVAHGKSEGKETKRKKEKRKEEKRNEEKKKRKEKRLLLKRGSCNHPPSKKAGAIVRIA